MKSNSSLVLLSTALKSPAAFHEQRRSLERARVRYLLPKDLYSMFLVLIALLVTFLLGQPLPHSSTQRPLLSYFVPPQLLPTVVLWNIVRVRLSFSVSEGVG